MKKRQVQDTTVLNLHAQKKVNDHLKAQIGKLKDRLAALERALRFVMRSVRVR